MLHLNSYEAIMVLISAKWLILKKTAVDFDLM